MNPAKWISMPVNRPVLFKKGTLYTLITPEKVINSHRSAAEGAVKYFLIKNSLGSLRLVY
jgi:hypothetical protein